MTPPADRTAVVLWLSTWILLLGISASAVAAAWVNHDAGWYLHMAGAWLDGAVLYRDVIDTNPPLIVYLTVIPVLLGRMLHLPGPATFKTLIFLAALAAVAGAAAILRRLHPSDLGRLLVLSALLFLVLPFVRADYGQREHIVTLLVTPYALASAAWAAGRPIGRKGDVAVGVLAGLGFAMKPHFLLAWAGAELCILLATEPQRRIWLRPAALGVATALALYGLIALLHVPQYFTVASEVARVYGGLNEQPATLLRLTELRVWLLALLMLAFVRLPSTQWRACLVIFVIATGFLLAALLQLKGWAYHLYPFRVFAGLYVAMVAAAILASHGAATELVRGGQGTVATVAAGALILMTVRYMPQTSAPAGVDQVRALHALVERERAESLAVLSMRTILFPAFPVVNYTRATWVMRHHSLWFLPGLYARELAMATGNVPYRAVGAMEPLERQFFEQVVGDLCAQPPRVLVVEPPLPADRPGPRSIDLLAYYGQDERFARLFRPFEPRETFGQFTAYVRRVEASCLPR